MRVGVISDTHDNLPLVDRALGFFQTSAVEYVVHAGDWIAPFTAKKFVAYEGKLFGAFGNNDGETLGLSRVFREMDAVVKGEFTQLELDGQRIAVMHGTYPAVVDAVARSARFDTVIFGHSHVPSVEQRGDVLLVNPGEACGYLFGHSTVAILDTGTSDARIHEL